MRADQFRVEHLKRSYVIAHGALRLLLAEMLNRSPSKVKLEIGTRGKPSLKQRDEVYFNMSHCDRLALYAITKDCELGVDVERVREINELDNISQTYFCEEEFSELLSFPSGPERNQAFVRCWTRKEAYIKATGDGMSCSLNQFRVSLSPQSPARFVHIGHSVDRARLWTLHHIDPAPGYVGALAYSGPEGDIILHTPVLPDCLLASHKSARQEKAPIYNEK